MKLVTFGKNSRLGTICFCTFILSGAVFAQNKLTLEEALKKAKASNGDVHSAYLNYEIAKKNEKVSYSAFLPSVTPSATYSFSGIDNLTGPGKGLNWGNSSNASIDANWRLWDNGSRKLNHDQAKISTSVASYNAQQTLRNTLFTVHQRFFDALRAQELYAVAQKSVERAKKIYDQTEYGARPEIGEYPKKDVYQAKADYLNAKVNELSTQTQTETTVANLKAVLAWDEGEFPELESPDYSVELQDEELQANIEYGLENRPDLKAQRWNIASQQIAIKAAELNGGVQYSVDASLSRIFSPNPSRNGFLSFSASIPLFDGGRTKTLIEIENLALEAQRESLRQLEYAVTAEIESAFREVSQNELRLEAAKAAQEAAEINYQAAVSAQAEGAGSLIEVLTAQVSLTTAESNLVQANYDALISQIRLNLAIGMEMPGESD